MTKKRHHFVPKVYLQPFCDKNGKVYVYRKDDLTNIHPHLPNSVGLQNYFYSQPRPDGEYDHDKLEDFFNEYESRWPTIVQLLRAQDNVNDQLEDIFAFIALQRARVPAARDACEAILAERVKAIARQMNKSGRLPPLPKGLEGILDHIDVAIDPHQSIHAMPSLIKGIRKLFDKIGICAMHNSTAVPFLTSDNPVIWFDPSVPKTEMRPYTIQPDGPIMLFFPVAPDLVIYGDSTLHDRFAREGLWHTGLENDLWIREINENICRFAYRTVFSQAAGFEDMVKEYADVSPVVQTQSTLALNGRFLINQYAWGQRFRKPKWER